MAAEDLEKMSDSNTDIKSRLSEALQGSAALDPERTFEGKPGLLGRHRLFTGGSMRSYQIEGIEWLRVRPHCLKGYGMLLGGFCGGCSSFLTWFVVLEVGTRRLRFTEYILTHLHIFVNGLLILVLLFSFRFHR